MIPARQFSTLPVQPKGGSREDAQLEDTLNTLYGIPEIKPLLDLVKLAVLGLHDFSGRKKFTEENYDSDDDVDESKPAGYRLKITIDLQSNRVNNVAHYGPRGLRGKNCEGVFFSNMVFVGWNRPIEEARGVLIHELVHSIAYEVFKNEGKPYTKGQDKIFTDIADDLKGDVTIPSLLRGSFSESYQAKGQVHSELIARTAELIASDAGGLTMLRSQERTRKLLDYYTTKFLPAVE